MGYKISPVFQKKNISRVDIIGAELDLDYNPVQWLSFYVNYSFSHSTITKFEATDTLVDKDLEGKFLTDVPMHKVTAGATFSNRYVSANLLFKYIGSRWINDQNEADPVLQISKYPAYSTFSMRLWHTFFKRMTVALNIDNIFNVLYIDDRLQESPGRIIMAEVSVTF
jgi:outer membrane receptor protein involved in Fe transport